ncbi:PAAR-like protein [Sinomicrobium weinanense]|uniref:DUF4280 domain-containing protein n=1 Tax=Sinomicrobium weinanense TaxID=2842200 RepID=A0A926JPR5_9FLAO|nr:PAAR-like protein [Sinomicrobium weinanense]MBC9795227.1 DUF4280 domain-containing protein [Sinomicrobium weinanense]MBU3122004.1 DUF4280 domain-containing protein [Sinomicrobium weinanense]
MAGEEKKNKKTPPEGKKFVMNGARIKCDLCSKPEGKLRVTSNDLKLQDMLWANINDTNGAQNLVFDGVCNHSKYGDKKPPCKSVIQLKGWDKPASVFIQDAPGILMESRNYCTPHSNQKIEITDSGQTAAESEIEKKDEHRVTSVEGPSEVSFNSVGEYRVTGYNVDEGEVDKASIKWAFRVDGKIWYLKRTGNTLNLRFNVKEHIGKDIQVIPYISSPDENNGTTTVLTNISLEFDGRFLLLRVVLPGAIQRFSYRAVSGRAGDNNSFDYSVERQRQQNVGPIPEGEYYINPQEIQYTDDRGFIDGLKGVVGGGTFPGGERSWGSARVWIKPDPVTVEGTVRGGFTIHGGSVPGSAGCIDLVEQEDEFFEKLAAYGEDMDRIELTVDYSGIQNGTITW